MHNHSFGEHYGVLINDLPVPLLARAVFVVDPAGIIRYAEIVPEIAQEPNYEPAPCSPQTSRGRVRRVFQSGLIQILRYSTALPWS